MTKFVRIFTKILSTDSSYTVPVASSLLRSYYYCSIRTHHHSTSLASEVAMVRFCQIPRNSPIDSKLCCFMRPPENSVITPAVILHQNDPNYAVFWPENPIIDRAVVEAEEGVLRSNLDWPGASRWHKRPVGVLSVAMEVDGYHVVSKMLRSPLLFCHRQVRDLIRPYFK